jgi:hypothetical protein
LLNSSSKKQLEISQDSISYEITIPNGYWKVEKGTLYLIKKDGTDLLIYKYQLLNKDTLVLKFENYMEIWLRREGRR